MNTSNYISEKNTIIGIKRSDLPSDTTPTTQTTASSMENAQMHLKTELERKNNAELEYGQEKLNTINLAIGIGALFFYFYKYKSAIYR